MQKLLFPHLHLISRSIPKLTRTERLSTIRDLIHELYTYVFIDKLPTKVPPLRAANHHIPVKIDKPWMALTYRLPEHHRTDE